MASKYAFEGVLCGAASFRTMYVVAPVLPAEFTPAFRKSVLTLDGGDASAPKLNERMLSPLMRVDVAGRVVKLSARM